MSQIKPEELADMPKSTLKSIYKTLNCWGWHWILGDAPEGWDEMPNYRKPYMDENIKTKYDILRPYMAVIKTKVSHWDVY